MVELSARIKDQHIQKSVHQNLKKRQNMWRWIWFFVFLALLGAMVYFAFRFTAYSESKIDNLIAEAHAAEQQYEFSKALDLYDQALLLKNVSKDNAAQAAFFAAGIYSSKNQHQKAQDYLRIAIDLRPENLPYLSALAFSQLKNNDLLGLAQTYADMQTVEPQDPQVALVGAWLSVARLESPSQLIQQALVGDQVSSSARLLEVVFQLADDPEQAVLSLDDLINSTDNSDSEKLIVLRETADQLSGDVGNRAYELVLIGSTLIDINENYLALYFLDQATNEDPEYRDAWIFKASAELNTQQLEQAENSLGEAVRLDPTYAFTRFLEGELLNRQARQQNLDLKNSEIFKKAIKKYVLAIEQGYDNEVSRIKLAQAQAQAGLFEEAVFTLEDGLANDAFDPTRLTEELFWINFEAQEYQAAESIAENYAEENPLLARAQGSWAMALYFVGDTGTAAQIADDTLATDQINPAALLVKGLSEQDKNLILRAIDVDIEGRIAKIAKEYL